MRKIVNGIGVFVVLSAFGRALVSRAFIIGYALTYIFFSTLASIFGIAVAQDACISKNATKRMHCFPPDG